MDTPLPKLPCAAIFANFFLAALLLSSIAEGRAQNLPGKNYSTLPDASGATAIAEYSYACNPALFAQLDSSVAAIVVAPSRFGMQELASGYVLAAQRGSSYAYGGALGGTGAHLYNELSATGFFAVPATEEFAAGIAIGVQRLGILNTPAQAALVIDIGAHVRIGTAVTAGMALHNITRSSFGDGTSVSQMALLSLGAEINPRVSVSAGTIVRVGATSSVLLAAVYRPADAVKFRFGISTFPRTAEGGFAWQFDAFTIAATLHYHDALGFSQTVACVYRW